MMRVSPLSGFHYSTDPFWFCWAQNTYNFVHGPTSRGVLTQWTPGSYWQSRVDKCCSQHVLHLQGTRAWQQLVTNNSFHNSAEQSRVFDFFFFWCEYGVEGCVQTGEHFLHTHFTQFQRYPFFPSLLPWFLVFYDYISHTSLFLVTYFVIIVVITVPFSCSNVINTFCVCLFSYVCS